MLEQLSRREDAEIILYITLSSRAAGEMILIMLVNFFCVPLRELLILYMYRLPMNR